MTLVRQSSPRRCLGALLLASTSAVAQAAVFQSVGNEPAILYDAPAVRGTRVAVAPRGMPFEVVVAQPDWVRVRDAGGALSWIEKKALVARRTVVVTDPAPVDVHAAADDASPIVFRAAPGVLLDLAGPAASGWVPVRHRDGAAGFVRSGSVWGE